MKAEISHHGFASGDRVSGVYLQQGRMLTDRDWNALCDRLRSSIERTAAPLAGDGAPRRGGVLTDFIEGDPTTHLWAAHFADRGGLVIAEGTIGDLAPADDGAPFSYRNQRDLPAPPPLAAGATLYVDLWDRIVTVFDEADLADPALHGADTCFVAHRVAQVKQCPAGALVETECGLALAHEHAPRIGDARFAISPRASTSGPDKCDPCAETVDIAQAVANHLFRLEVHDVAHSPAGQAEVLVLKWSHGNGAIQYDRPADFDHARLDSGYAYEIFIDEMELQAGLPPGGYDDRFTRGTLAHEDLSEVDAGLDRIRQWDGYCEIDLAGARLVRGWDRGILLSTTVAEGTQGRVELSGTELTLDLETVQVVLTLASDAGPARFLVGDYWLALARARVAEPDRVRALQSTPIGTRHRYCVLGEVAGDGQSFETLDARDKRRLGFPALSCLGADDVGYDPASCAYARSRNVTNVQEALDAFCARLQPPYWALRMNQGTGQEGAPATLLPCPVSVLVEDQDGLPVRGATVLFTAEKTDADQVFEKAEDVDPNAKQRVQEVVTDESGHAQAWWWVAEPEGCHRLCAQLAEAPQGKAGEVWFAAEVRRIKARDVVYEPGCAFLRDKGADDVEEALDLLCNAMSTKEDLPRIGAVSWPNDAVHSLQAFLSGLVVEFTGPLKVGLISPDVFIVTLEVPEQPVGQIGALGFRPMIVAGQVVDEGQQKCRFVPLWPERVDAWLREKLAELPGLEKPELPGLRCRVRLLGRMIKGDEKDEMLDGFVPGIPRGDDTIDLDFQRTGLGHPSDFESWFYLTVNDQPDPLIDINRASLDELTSLPNVSPEMARNIIDRRPFSDVSDLTRVPGIGEVRLNALTPLVKI